MDDTVVIASAIYDNKAESKDELSFLRGDIVTVLEQNTSGLEGWWLCSLNGKKGIAPGNRLRLLPGFHDLSQVGATRNKRIESTYDVPSSFAWMTASDDVGEDEEYDVPRQQLKYSDSAISPSEVYDVPKLKKWRRSSSEEVYDTPVSSFRHLDDHLQEVYDVPNSFAPDPRELYDVPPIVSRDFHNSDEVYDVPTRRTETISNEMIPVLNPEEVYDVPSSIRNATSEFTPTRHDSVDSDVVYDIPQSNRMAGGTAISSGLNSLRRMKREIKASRREHHQLDYISEPQAHLPEYVYDVPPQVTKDQSIVSPSANAADVVDGLLKDLSLSDTFTQSASQSNRFSRTSRDSISSLTDDISQYRELKISLDDAVTELISLKQKLEDAVSKLLTLVKENWRKVENIANKVHEVQKSFVDVVIAVNQFLVYARGATANAFLGNDRDGERAPKHVQIGLRKLLVPLEEDLKMLTGALEELESCQWNINKLATDSNKEDGLILDEVDSFVMTSRAVSDDADQMAVFVHTHAQLIFKNTETLNVQSTPSKSHSSESIARPIQEIQALQARPLPDVPPVTASSIRLSVSKQKENEGWLDDYDYVALPENNAKDDSLSESDANKKLLTGLDKRNTRLMKLEISSQVNSETYELTSQEKEILRKLEIDLPDLLKSLFYALDRFIKAISSGESPPTFVALGKHVILCAHKLVFVGDCVYQHLLLSAAKQMIKKQCAAMCAVLKRTVASTKLAALQWPSRPALQDMIDKMCDIGTCAQQIRDTLLHILSDH